MQKAFASGLFIFADADMKFDQPQVKVVFDRDKLRSQGVDLSQAGRDLSTMMGGDYVNRFSMQGRSYKVIPQIKRTERLTPDQLMEVYVTGSEDKLVPLSTFARLETIDRATGVEEVPAAQCRAHPGRHSSAGSPRPGAELPRTGSQGHPASGLHDRLRRGVCASCGLKAARFLGTFLLSAILIYLVLAAQFESFRDPFIILAGSVPLAIAGALLFSFLGFTTLNIYSQVGLITLVGSRSRRTAS